MDMDGLSFDRGEELSVMLISLSMILPAVACATRRESGFRVGGRNRVRRATAVSSVFVSVSVSARHSPPLQPVGTTSGTQLFSDRSGSCG
jgi:hypothetical protein